MYCTAVDHSDKGGILFLNREAEMLALKNEVTPAAMLELQELCKKISIRFLMESAARWFIKSRYGWRSQIYVLCIEEINHGHASSVLNPLQSFQVLICGRK